MEGVEAMRIIGGQKSIIHFRRSGRPVLPENIGVADSCTVVNAVDPA